MTPRRSGASSRTSRSVCSRSTSPRSRWSIRTAGRRASSPRASAIRTSTALQGLTLDLERQPSGIAAALRDEAPFAVFDASASSAVSKKLERVGVKSAAFVPVFAASRAVGVLVLGTRAPRVFEARRARGHAGVRVAGGPRSRAGGLVGRAHGRARARASRLADLARGALAARSRRAARASPSPRPRARSAGRGASSASASRARRWRSWRNGTHPASRRSANADRLPVVNLAMQSRQTVAVADVTQAPELRGPGSRRRPGAARPGRARGAGDTVARGRAVARRARRATVGAARRGAPPTSRSPRRSPARPRRRSRPRVCCGRASSGSPSRARC